MNVCVCVCLRIYPSELISGCLDQLDSLLVISFSLLVCAVYTAREIKPEQSCVSTTVDSSSASPF